MLVENMWREAFKSHAYICCNVDRQNLVGHGHDSVRGHQVTDIQLQSRNKKQNEKS